MKLGLVRLPNLDWVPRRLSVGHKVAGFATLSTIAVLVISAGMNIYEAKGLVDRQLQAALRAAESSFAAKIEDQAKRALTAAAILHRLKQRPAIGVTDQERARNSAGEERG